MSPAGPLIKLTEVTKRFDSPDGASGITVLDRISLEVNDGESLAVVGPSGSGKSTLLHIIGTLDRPTSGEVLFAGKDIGGLNEAEVSTLRNLEIGFVFQAHYLLPQCTVLENVLVPTLAGHSHRLVSPKLQSEGGKPFEPFSARAHRLLARVGLSDRLAHRSGQLSGGERQRVAVVRALINAPRLLLADEPTGSLDQASSDELARLLFELNQEEKVTLIIVTHSKELASRMGRVLALRGGKLTPA